VNDNWARFSRPTVDSQGFEKTSPGARVRFNITGAAWIAIKLRYTALVIRLDTYNDAGIVLVDGANIGTIHSTAPKGTPADVTGTFLITPGLHTVEFVLPYCASVDFTGLTVPQTATILSPPARPTTRYVAVGDSITHGFLSSDINRTWPYLTAVSKKWQLINLGYGSRECNPVDGTTAGNFNPDVVTYLIGYNNFAGQTPLATFKNSYKAFIHNLRAIRPSIKVYCITPLYSTNTNTLTLENYRQQIRDVLAELNNPLNVLIEGVALTGTVATAFQDNIHPNDYGSGKIAAGLLPLMGL